ncbi:MAG TPA: hypothetical protein VHA52_08090 [Candidatus Babeliaceae bacterium]|nr:hypothetical protein [Candidatus Babeliaceae bacterium]
MLTITPQLLYIGNDPPYLIFIGGLVIILSILCLLSLIPSIFFLFTLQNTLKAVSPHNRKLRPGQIWLLLVPIFSYIWFFYVVDGIAESIYDEYKSKGVTMNKKPTLSLGIAMSILYCTVFMWYILSRILINVFLADHIFAVLYCFIGFILTLAFATIWIIYWVKLNEYKNSILALPQNNEQSQSSKKYFITF